MLRRDGHCRPPHPSCAVWSRSFECMGDRRLVLAPGLLVVAGNGRQEAQEARQLAGQRVDPRLQGAEGREFGRQAGCDDLMEAERIEVLEAVCPQVGEADVLREPVGEQRGHDVRYDDLPAVGGRLDPCRPVDLDADVVALRETGLARVEAHPDPDRRMLRPRLRRQRSLRLDRGRQRLGRVGEHDEKTVAFGSLLDAAVARKRGPKDRPVTRPEARVRGGPHALFQSARSLDVGEQERDQLRRGLRQGPVRWARSVERTSGHRRRGLNGDGPR